VMRRKMLEPDPRNCPHTRHPPTLPQSRKDRPQPYQGVRVQSEITIPCVFTPKPVKKETPAMKPGP
jgi:hypothetical protein